MDVWWIAICVFAGMFFGTIFILTGFLAGYKDRTDKEHNKSGEKYNKNIIWKIENGHYIVSEDGGETWTMCSANPFDVSALDDDKEMKLFCPMGYNPYQE